MTPVVYAVDVGSTKPRGRKGCSFAWGRVSLADGRTGPATSDDIDGLLGALRDDLGGDIPVALGFEAPLFLPVPDSSSELSRGRPGEGSRAWSAQAGAYVASLAVHQSAWLLRELKMAMPSLDATVYTNAWAGLGSGKIRLLLWEAFVSEGAHSSSHIEDAATAVNYFKESWPNLDSANAGLAIPDTAGASRCTTLSLIGSVLLWSGLATDPRVLRHPVLVLRPQSAYEGPVTAWKRHGSTVPSSP